MLDGIDDYFRQALCKEFTRLAGIADVLAKLGKQLDDVAQLGKQLEGMSELSKQLQTLCANAGVSHCAYLLFFIETRCA